MNIDNNSVSEVVNYCGTDENDKITARFETITPTKNCSMDERGNMTVQGKFQIKIYIYKRRKK